MRCGAVKVDRVTTPSNTKRILSNIYQIHSSDESLLSSRSGTVEIMKLALAIGAFGVAVVVNQGAIVACRHAQAATDAPERASSGCEAHLHRA